MEYSLPASICRDGLRPHVRIMKTGYEDIEDAKKFGLPYIVLREPAPYDTTTLNYNWQIWETKAYSLYTQETGRIDKKSAVKVIDSVMRFMERNGIISYSGKSGHVSDVISESELLAIVTAQSGIFESCVEVENQIKEGDVLAPSDIQKAAVLSLHGCFAVYRILLFIYTGVIRIVWRLQK